MKTNLLHQLGFELDLPSIFDNKTSHSLYVSFRCNVSYAQKAVIDANKTNEII